MATHLQRHAMLSDDTIQRRLEIAIYDAAIDVLNEDPQTEQHAERMAWANAAISDLPTMAKRMKLVVLTNAAYYAAEEPESEADQSWRDAKADEAIAGAINQFLESE